MNARISSAVRRVAEPSRILKQSGIVRLDVISELGMELRERYRRAVRSKGSDKALALYDAADCVSVLRREYEIAADLAQHERSIKEILPERSIQGVSKDPFNLLVRHAIAEKDRALALETTLEIMASSAASEEIERLGLSGSQAQFALGDLGLGRTVTVSSLADGEELGYLVTSGLAVVSNQGGKDARIILTAAGQKAYMLLTNLHSDDSFG